MIEALLILGALLLVGACGAFVAAEFSFITVDRAAVERAAAQGDRGAEGILAALRTLSTQLSAAQVGITATNLAIGFMAEPSIAELIDGPLESAGLGEGAAHAVAIVIALTLATGVTMIFGELVPKNLAIARPLATARAVHRFQRAFAHGTAALIRATNGTADAVLRRLGIEPQEELASARSAEELASLVDRSAKEGYLASETATLLQRSLAFGDRRADDVMTPRVRMHTIDADSPVVDVLTRARETGHSRFPVVEEGSDAVLGIVHIKDAMGVPHEHRDTVRVREVLIDPVLVPSTIELDALLEMLRHGGVQMAIVVDEFGGVDGIVTLEDLIEEIVGEVRDEYDPLDDRARLHSDGSWMLSGLLRPDEVTRLVGLELPEDDDYETLGGLIGMVLGRLPEPGDAVELDTRDTERAPHRVSLTVVRLDGLRVDRVRLRSEPIEDEDEENGEDRP